VFDLEMAVPALMSSISPSIERTTSSALGSGLEKSKISEGRGCSGSCQKGEEGGKRRAERPLAAQ